MTETVNMAIVGALGKRFGTDRPEEPAFTRYTYAAALRSERNGVVAPVVRSTVG